jgi:hypothetical protein
MTANILSKQMWGTDEGWRSYCSGVCVGGGGGGGANMTHRKHDKIISFIYSPTDAPVSCLKNNIKIYIKTAPTYFGVVTPSSGSALFVLTYVTVVKIIH